MSEIKYEIIIKIGVLSKYLYGLTESEFAQILSTSLVIYQLYGLTQDEIDIVEGKNNESI